MCSSDLFPGAFPNAEVVGNPVRTDVLALPLPQQRLAGREGPVRVLGRGAGSPAPPCRCAPCFFGVFVLWVVSLPSGGRARSQLSPRGVFRRAETAFSLAFLLASFCASLAIRGDTILIHDFGMA